MSEEIARKRFCLGCSHRFNCKYMIIVVKNNVSWCHCGNFTPLKDYAFIDLEEAKK